MSSINGTSRVTSIPAPATQPRLAVDGDPAAAATAPLGTGASDSAILLRISAQLDALLQAVLGHGLIGTAPAAATPAGGPDAPRPAVNDVEALPAPTPAPTPDPAPVSAPAPAATAAPPLTHTVVAGDTLAGIARKHGIADFHAIYDLNRDLIGPDANRIKPGQVLRLPDGAIDAPPAPAHRPSVPATPSRPTPRPTPSGGSGAPRPQPQYGGGSSETTSTPAPAPAPAPAAVSPDHEAQQFNNRVEASRGVDAARAAALETQHEATRARNQVEAGGGTTGSFNGHGGGGRF